MWILGCDVDKHVAIHRVVAKLHRNELLMPTLGDLHIINRVLSAIHINFAACTRDRITIWWVIIVEPVLVAATTRWRR